jgi:hypothetical protein
VHRKLVHPSLGNLHRERLGDDPAREVASGPARRPRGRPSRPVAGRPGPPTRTHAEEFYYVKQMHLGTPLGAVLEGGETLRGTIEWYDRGVICFVPETGPPRLLFKRSIRYLFKLEEE